MKLKVTSLLEQSRIKILQQKLKDFNLDACLVETSVDLFYLTGLKLSVGKLLVHSTDALLLVDGRYLQAAKDKSPVPVVLDDLKEVTSFCKKHHIKQLGFDGRHTSYDHYLRLTHQELPKLVSKTDLFKLLRAVKSPEEIALMKKSAKLAWQGFEFVCTLLKKGVTEKELSVQFEIFCLERGAEKMAFEPIIAFGKNSAMPHYRSKNARLKSGDIVLVDIGVVLNGYNSDMTRVIFYKKPNPRLSKLYEITKEAQESALELCRPGVKLKEIDAAARKVMARENVEELFVHGLGHGIGLEAHEFPRVASQGDDKDFCLQPGMVITIEPGLYVPGKGGVRFEDTIAITETGYTNFYSHYTERDSKIGFRLT